MEKTVYTATVVSKGARDGHIHSSDGILDMELAIVDGLGRVSGKHAGTNPEQLFAGGYAACFESTVMNVAEAMKIELEDTSVTGIVNLKKGADGMFLSVRLEVALPGIDEKTGQMLIEEAHLHCPYSKATRGNIEVEIVLVGGD